MKLPASFSASRLVLPCACALVLSQPGFAQTTPDAAPTSLEPFTVTGGRERVWTLPGSASYVNAEDFRATGYTAFSRVAAKIPGVYVREEDGFGNFLNISIRGVDGTRSNKVTLMEDGILTAPSPYAAPAAYYSPKLGRMSAIEVLKGSSQIAYGPHTTGGVVNFLSTPTPDSATFFSRTTYGSDDTWFNQTWYGDVHQTPAGRVGYLVELHGQTTQGYRAPDGGRRDAGFDLVEPMVKLFWEPVTSVPQRLELKVGYTRFDANESYSGVTESDLRMNPNRRYAGSQFDRLDSEHWRTYLKYVVRPNDDLRFESALYYNSFVRTWDKLDAVSGTGLQTNVAAALLHAPSLAVLQGLGTGNVVTRAAYRDHESMGWQNQLTYRLRTGEVRHDLTVGLRLHEDSVTGRNRATTYASTGTGSFGPAQTGAASSAGEQKVFASALHVENNVQFGRWSVRPGLRYEFLDWTNVTGTGAMATGDQTLVMSGVGFTYDLTGGTSLFGGVYRGSSPANPAGYQAGTQSEKSLGFETGIRHHREALRAELIAFYTDFSRLIAPQVGIGAGGVAPSSNAGEADVRGLEALIEYDFGRAAGLGLAVPVYVSATWTDAQFKGLPQNGRLGNGAGVFAGARNGHEIPYVPEWKLAAGVGVAAAQWGARVDMSYVSSTWSTGYNGQPRLNDGANTLAAPTAVDGRVDSLWLVDVSGNYRVHERVKLLAGVQNIFNERGIISRLPLGPRANAPRMIFAGIEATF
jgi:Fe(3+) dicitrate transport protein